MKIAYRDLFSTQTRHPYLIDTQPKTHLSPLVTKAEHIRTADLASTEETQVTQKMKMITTSKIKATRTNKSQTFSR